LTDWRGVNYGFRYFLLLFLIKASENGSFYHCIGCYHWFSFIFEMIFAQPELDKVLFD
jgi:hypothetical protein